VKRIKEIQLGLILYRAAPYQQFSIGAGATIALWESAPTPSFFVITAKFMDTIFQPSEPTSNSIAIKLKERTQSSISE
jgi:hypothetical protein